MFLSCIITFRLRRNRDEVYIGHARLCVCLSVCPSPPSHATARTRRNVGGMVGSALLGRFAINARVSLLYRRTQNVSDCLYSLYAWFLDITKYTYLILCLKHIWYYHLQAGFRSVQTVQPNRALQIYIDGLCPEKNTFSDLLVILFHGHR